MPKCKIAYIAAFTLSQATNLNINGGERTAQPICYRITEFSAGAASAAPRVRKFPFMARKRKRRKSNENVW